MSVLEVQEQVGDPQRAQPLAGVVGENNLMRGDGPAEVDGGGRDGDGPRAGRGPVPPGSGVIASPS